MISLQIDDLILELPESPEEPEMCLELRDCHKRLFWNLSPYGEPDLVTARGGRRRVVVVGSILRRRSTFVSEGVEEWFFVHDYEMGNGGTNDHFINHGAIILTDPPKAMGWGLDSGAEDPRK